MSTEEKNPRPSGRGAINEQEGVLSEIKTLVRVLNTWGNVLVPDLNGKQVHARERLHHFIFRAMHEFGMTAADIDAIITNTKEDVL